MNPVSKTAYYCCGVRAEDARRPRPVVGDRFAERFMDADGRAVFDRFRRFALPNRSNAWRHRLIDDIARETIARDAGATMVLIGAGFDSRAFRLDGGRWFEIDEAPVIALKDRLLPAADCPNPLQRTAIDFERESLAERLPPAPAGEVLVIVEGVTMYLDAETLRGLCATLRTAYPRGRLACDLMSAPFITQFGGPVLAELAAIDAHFRLFEDEPSRLILEAGYRLERSGSIAAGAFADGPMRLLRPIVEVFRPRLFGGYTVNLFAVG